MSLDQELFKRLKNNDKTLTDLDLQYADLRDSGTKNLSNALLTNKILTFLDLIGNNIGDQGVKFLANVLSTNTSLTTLYLGNNDIGDYGVKDLANAIINNKTLAFLHLSVNNIGDQGAKALAVSLTKNVSLTTLYLDDNNIGDSGVNALDNALLFNKTLTHLYLDSNNFSNNGTPLLFNIFKWNMSLITLCPNQIIDNQIDTLTNRNNNFSNQLLSAITEGGEGYERNIIQVEELLEWGVSPMSSDENNNTAMHLAVIKSNIPAIRLLLEHNASLFVLNSDKKTPLDLAKEQDKLEILALLKDFRSSTTSPLQDNFNQFNNLSSNSSSFMINQNPLEVNNSPNEKRPRTK